MITPQASHDLQGLLFIGDPHLEARIPGFRKDDYPQVALQKFRWCLQFARQHQLQPILLGDLFQLPQDNPNWLVSSIIESIDEPLPAIYGNHDVRENSLKPNDSIHILFAGGHLQRLSEDTPWIGTVGGTRVVVGGTVWGERLPKQFDPKDPDHALTVWVTHHDIFIPGYEYHHMEETKNGPELYSQIPKGFAGKTCPLDDAKADASAWLDQLPVVKQFRKSVLGQK